MARVNRQQRRRGGEQMGDEEEGGRETEEGVAAGTGRESRKLVHLAELASEKNLSAVDKNSNMLTC